MNTHTHTHTHTHDRNRKPGRAVTGISAGKTKLGKLNSVDWLVRISSVGFELKGWSWSLGTWPQGELGRGTLLPAGMCGSGLVYLREECSSLGFALRIS